MDARTKERLMTYEALFDSPGWALFLEEFINPEVEELPERVFTQARSWDEVLAGRAAYAKLREIQVIPAIIEAQRAEAEEGDYES